MNEFREVQKCWVWAHKCPVNLILGMKRAFLEKMVSLPFYIYEALTFDFWIDDLELWKLIT